MHDKKDIKRHMRVPHVTHLLSKSHIVSVRDDPESNWRIWLFIALFVTGATLLLYFLYFK